MRGQPWHRRSPRTPMEALRCQRDGRACRRLGSVPRCRGVGSAGRESRVTAPSFDGAANGATVAECLLHERASCGGAPRRITGSARARRRLSRPATPAGACSEASARDLRRHPARRRAILESSNATILEGAIRPVAVRATRSGRDASAVTTARHWRNGQAAAYQLAAIVSLGQGAWWVEGDGARHRARTSASGEGVTVRR